MGRAQWLAARCSFRNRSAGEKAGEEQALARADEAGRAAELRILHVGVGQRAVRRIEPFQTPVRMIKTDGRRKERVAGAVKLARNDRDVQRIRSSFPRRP